jgi:spore germination protein GerM
MQSGLRSRRVKKIRRPLRDRSALIIAFLICAMVLGALMLKKYEMRSKKPVVPPQEQKQGTLLVTLFFASQDGDALVREGREIDTCEDPAKCIEAVLGELINGPLGNLSPTLPPATTIHSVRIEGDRAIIDMSDEIVNGLPGGSNSEMTAVYSIIDTIAVNFPRIKLVKLLINGKAVETLKGHLDLREPLGPDFSLEQKSQ